MPPFSVTCRYTMLHHVTHCYMLLLNFFSVTCRYTLLHDVTTCYFTRILIY